MYNGRKKFWRKIIGQGRNNLGLLHGVYVRCISDYLVKDLEYRSYFAKVLPLLSAKKHT